MWPEVQQLEDGGEVSVVIYTLDEDKWYQLT